MGQGFRAALQQCEQKGDSAYTDGDITYQHSAPPPCGIPSHQCPALQEQVLVKLTNSPGRGRTMFVIRLPPCSPGPHLLPTWLAVFAQSVEDAHKRERCYCRGRGWLRVQWILPKADVQRETCRHPLGLRCPSWTVLSVSKHTKFIRHQSFQFPFCKMAFSLVFHRVH